jgi:hypothetical protein
MRYFAIREAAVAAFFGALLIESKPIAAALSLVPTIRRNRGPICNQHHAFTTPTHPTIRKRTNPNTTQLYGIRDLFRSRFGGGSNKNQEPTSGDDDDAQQPPLIITAPPSVNKKVPQASSTNTKQLGKQQSQTEQGKLQSSLYKLFIILLLL